MCHAGWHHRAWNYFNARLNAFIYVLTYCLRPACPNELWQLVNNSGDYRLPLRL